MLESNIIYEMIKIGLFIGIVSVGIAILVGEGINLLIKLFKG
jgi:hypothetical protein